MGNEINQPDSSVLDALARMDLLRPGETPRFTPLTGGVASDIWKVEAGDRVFCVKRALGKLRVKDEWRVSEERNAFEVGWIETARRIVPDCAPELFGADRRTNLFAMRWLPPLDYPVWKALLMQGRVREADAAAMGAAMGAIHAATANHPDIASRFRTDVIFRDIRLEAYLGAAALRHPDLSDRLHELIETTAYTRYALVHGDMSPKNILIGPKGPVFLDAECAWYGDPAFDLAFCLNHLLLKCLWRRDLTGEYLASFSALAESHLGQVSWEPRDNLNARAAALLPGLMLARIDGKSPVEYLTRDAYKDMVRRAAAQMLRDPPDRLDAVRMRWRRELA